MRSVPVLAFDETTRMKPFFSYFGSKYRLAKFYPSPLPDVPIVEPFAGSAAYSVYYNAPKAILYDVNPCICGIWDYLIKVSPVEVMALPDRVVESTEEVKAPQAARDLIGFWLAKARGAPAKKIGPWARDYYSDTRAHVWGPAVKVRLASQVEKIRGWQIIQGSFDTCPDIRATWFIDPPYVTTARKTYVFNKINYLELAAFSYSRRGMALNCDDISAPYLPFLPFHETLGIVKRTREALHVTWLD